MEILIIYGNYKLNCKKIKYDHKNNIHFFKPKYNNLKKLFKFIFQIEKEENKKLYQIEINEYKLVKFIKNNDIYFQNEKIFESLHIIFRYDKYMNLFEIIIS
jgi:hypothetical protein